jgi:glycosyltransferase involved in cell wall biosynthesis
MEYHPDEYVGGSEIQVFGLARQFASAGHEVTYICQRYDRSRPTEEMVNGVRVLRVLRWRRAFRFLAGFRMVPVVRRLKPQIVYQRFASSYTGLAALSARATGAPFVWGCAEDASLETSFRFRNLDKPSGGALPRLKQTILRFDATITNCLFHWGIRHAGAVIVQNRWQQNALRQNFGRDGHVIPNGIALRAPETGRSDRPLVLWLNRVARRKDPEAFIRLASSLEPGFPDAQFVLVGGRQNDQYLEEVQRAAAAVGNLRLTGSVPPAEVPRWFEKAWVFVLTSAGEGFPNVLLQAWASGVPVVSLVVDPDDLIAREGLGLLSGTQEGLERDVTLLLEDAGMREKLATVSRAYVAEHFEFAKVAERYLALFDHLIRP